MKVRKVLFLALYYSFARKLPRSTSPVVGPLARRIRYVCCKQIFAFCGEGVNVERNAYFGFGDEIEIGDFSGLGCNSVVPSNLKVGRYVMMAPNVVIFRHNHEYKDLEIPMALQGIKPASRVKIGDDCWIGQGAYVNPGMTIHRGTIIAAGTVLTKEFPEFSIVGGNPGRLIGVRNHA